MGIERNFSPDDVYEFLKLLIELGGAHYIDNEHCIRATGDNTPVGVKINNGKDGARKIALFKENMPINSDVVFLNPFAEEIGVHPERLWFYRFIGVVPGCMIKKIIGDIGNIASGDDKDTKNFKMASLMSKFIDRIDNKFVDELEKIKAYEIAFIYYGPDKNIAQLQSALWDEKFEQKMKSRIRKSTLMLIRDIVSTLLGGQPETIMYKATLIGCPQFDAVSHVLAETMDKIYKVYEALNPDVQLHVPEIKEHMDHLEAYHRALQWLATSTTSSVKEKSGQTTVTEFENKDAPWKAAVTADGSSTAGLTVGVPTAAVAAVNPSYGMNASPVMPSVGEHTGVHPVMPTFRAPLAAAAPMANPMMMGGISPVGVGGFGGMPTMTGMPMMGGTPGFGSPFGGGVNMAGRLW